MTDLERRLREALRAAAEPAPPGLLDAVVRRHRRHRIRLGASAVAVLAAAVLAVPSVAGALRGEGTAGGGTPAVRSGGGHSPGPRHRPAAAPGTVLSGCAGANAGALGRHWQAQPSVKAGPLWFLDDGHSSGPIRLYVAIAALDGLRPGSVVVARVPPAWRPYLRFLYGPADLAQPGCEVHHAQRRGRRDVRRLPAWPGDRARARADQLLRRIPGEGCALRSRSGVAAWPSASGHRPAGRLPGPLAPAASTGR